jgi:hypothetical protein
MTSLSIGEHEESLFLLHEQPPENLRQSQSFDRIKPIRLIHSASSSITSTTLPNQQYRSLSSQNLTSPFRLSLQQLQCSSPNDIDSFVNQFERRLDEHRLTWQREYDRKIEQMIETKTNELTGLKLRYGSKLNELADHNRQLEIHSGQINEENKRLKIEIDHEKQQNKLEQVEKKNN